MNCAIFMMVLLLIPDMEEHDCPICGSKMNRMQACHLHCGNCGAMLDCSDKGTFW